jgi:hypothetical protein
MRLDKLRGYGPWFAFSIPFLVLFTMGYLAVISSMAISTSSEAGPPAWFGIATAVLFILFGLIVIAGLAVAIDLEWIEHPQTNTAWTYVGLVAYAVAALAFVLYFVEGFFNQYDWAVFVVTVMAFFGGLGLYLVVMNVVGMRAGLLGRVLPWVGILSGALFVLAALMIPIHWVDTSGLAAFPSLALYLAWSLWLGFRLRGKSPAPATP